MLGDERRIGKDEIAEDAAAERRRRSVIAAVAFQALEVRRELRKDSSVAVRLQQWSVTLENVH